MSEGCLLCGSPLQYSDEAKEMKCAVCGRTFLSNVCCAQGHYICDDCHASPAESVIRSIAQKTVSTDPIDIAHTMMQSPAVHMHGPEHHFLVSAALFAAYRNAGGVVSDHDLDAIIARGKKVPGGFCGMAGCCGAAVSAGIFYSVVTKTTPLSTDSWGDSMKMTAACLNAIAEFGGPRCCKRDSFVSIITAAEIVVQSLSVALSLPETVNCAYSSRNAECLKTQCLFYSP